jgi:hypothetical protein
MDYFCCNLYRDRQLGNDYGWSVGGRVLVELRASNGLLQTDKKEFVVVNQATKVCTVFQGKRKKFQVQNAPVFNCPFLKVIN